MKMIRSLFEAASGKGAHGMIWKMTTLNGL